MRPEPTSLAARPGSRKNPALRVVPRAIEKTPKSEIYFFSFNGAVPCLRYYISRSNGNKRRVMQTSRAAFVGFGGYRDLGRGKLVKRAGAIIYG